MKDITTRAQLDQLLKEPTAVVKFSAVWCGPCKQMAPIFNKLDEEFKSVKTGGVDLDQSQDIAKEFGVTSVPQFIFFKNGAIVNTVKGADRSGVRAGFEQLAAMATTMPKVGGHSLKAPSVKSSAINSGFSLYKWVSLYFSTLFSFDARKAASTI